MEQGQSIIHSRPSDMETIKREQYLTFNFLILVLLWSVAAMHAQMLITY